MQQEKWEKVKEILQEVLERSSSERSDFLDEANLDDEVRAELESLLAYENDVEGLMDLPAVEFSKQFFASDQEAQNALLGQQIGIYKILKELGFGGMGTVYLADRTDGKFEQKVALKLLKREMNTGEIRRRFEQERKILASLEHPNIARLLDAGTTDDKIPFLAMEYVEGLPITDYCESQNLSLEARLDLFRSVCRAVNFAHRNLIVHRDLKPSNIFVTKDGVPKLLDFGISKILSTDFENLNAATVTKLGAMTPAYASPEQLQNKSVTTATDIYSLGVILYELLSNHRPFEKEEKDLKEIYRAVLEVEPPPPSAMIEAISKSLKEKTIAETELREVKLLDFEDTSNNFNNKTAPSKAFQTSPRTIIINAQSLRGDLDNIVLKALRKEPERRYLSAEDLAEDIKRYLRGLPVTARPNTFSYRTEKFIKRNRPTVVAGALILIAIIGGIIATIWQSRVAASERDRARLEAKKAQKINEYMQKVLNFSNPHWLSSNPQRNSKATIGEAIDESLKNIDAELINEPEIQAEILFTISQTYTSQGQFEKAEKLLRKAIEKFNQVLGSPNQKSMQAAVILADTLYLKGKYEEAKILYLESIDYFRPVVDKDNSHLKWMVIALNDLGNVYMIEGNFDEAIKSIGESNKYAENIADQDRFVVPIITGNYGSALTQVGDFETSLIYFKKAIGELQKMGNGQSYEAGQMLNLMGGTYNQTGDYESAERILQQGYDILIISVGEKNPYALSTSLSISRNYCNQGKYQEAEKMIVKSLEAQHEVYPQGHFLIGASQSLLGEIYTKTNKLKEGEENIRKGLEMLFKVAKEPNHLISQAKTALGENLIAQKRYAEAEQVLTSALDGYVKTRGENHPFTKKCREISNKIPR